MRGSADRDDSLFCYVRLGDRVPQDHQLRAIRELTDEVLTPMDARLDLLGNRTNLDPAGTSASGHAVAGVLLGVRDFRLR